MYMDVHMSSWTGCPGSTSRDFTQSTHRDELFRTRRVYRNRIVEMLPSLRPCESATAKPCSISSAPSPMRWQPTIFSSSPVTISFIATRHFVLAEGIHHRIKARLVNLDVIAVLFACFIFRQSDRADRRMREDDRRDRVVLEASVRHAVVEAIGQPPAGRNGNRRQCIAARYIAQSRRCCSTLVFCHSSVGMNP